MSSSLSSPPRESFVSLNDVVSSKFDAYMLHKAVRLVHCIQKERGASCAYRAAANASTDDYPIGRTTTMATTTNMTQKHQPLIPARRETDRAMQRLNSRPVERVTLDKIRTMVVARVSFHQILASFNTLIQSIVHEYLLPHTKVQKRRRTYSHSSNSSNGTTNGNVRKNNNNGNTNNSCGGANLRLRRTGSHDAILRQLHDNEERFFGGSSSRTMAPLATATTGKLRRAYSEFGGRPSSNPELWLDPRVMQGSPPSFLPPEPPLDGDDRSNVVCNDEGAGPRNGVMIGMEEENYDNDDEDEDDDEDDGDRLVRLLGLLVIFVRLKESTGVERAILTSMITASPHDSRLMLTDLVLQVETQRRHVGKLPRYLLQHGCCSLTHLVQDLVAMSPKMKQLQDTILQGCDVDSLKQNLDFTQGDLWQLMTLYIDKLHSLELVILEEVESCGGDDQLVLSGGHGGNEGDAGGCINQTSPDAMSAKNSLLSSWCTMFDVVSSSALGDTDRNISQALTKRIESLSAAKVKNVVLSTLSASDTLLLSDPRESAEVSAAAAGTPVEELLAELSKAPASKEWEIDLYEIRFLKRIGQGSAGTTYLADWCGLDVAVKVASISEMGLDGWRTEVQALQKLHHPNIIRLLGSVYHPSPLTFCLVLEYCSAGDLSAALLRVTPRNFFFNVSNGISKGMSYLHNRGVIHRDIKPGNVLLDGDVAVGTFAAKVTDFGMATEMGDSADRTAETGTYRWMAPEVIRHEYYTQTADVFSFAIVLWQLLTREDPFQNTGQVEAAAAVALEHQRPPFPEGTPLALRDFIETCWSSDPSARFSFDIIVQKLKEIEAALTADEKTWLETGLGHAVYKRKVVASAAAPLVLPKTPTEAEPKKGKGFRKIFNRKSTHF